MNDAKLEQLIKPLIGIYDSLELELIKDIALRLNTYDGVKGSLKWYLDKLQDIGGFNTENLALLAEYAGKSQAEVKRILQYAGYDTTKLDKYKDFIDDETLLNNPTYLYESTTIQNVINNAIKETNSIMGMIQTKALESAKEEYMKILTDTYIKVSSGVYSYDMAIKQGLKELAKEGFTGAAYKNGKRLSLESTVRRDILTRTHQLAGDIELEKAKELGTNLVYVTQHLGARIRTKYTKEDYEAHFEWQGKVYMIDGSNDKYDNFYEKTGYGEMLGLCGVNCRHHFYATYEGMSHSELFNEEENEKEYLKQQEQRKYERSLRQLKREKEIAKTLDDKEEFSFANKRMRLFNKKYKQFLEENDLQRDYGREYIEKDLVKIDNEKLGSGNTTNKLVEPHKKMKKLGEIQNLNHEKAISLLEGYEKKIVDRDIENAIIILDDGKYYQCYGIATNVYPYYDLANSKELIDRKILYMTHNHPIEETNYSFDGDDRNLWGNHEELLVLRHIDNKYTSQFSRLNNYVDESKNYSIFDEIPEEDYQHEFNIEYARSNDYGYKRTKNDDV